MICNKNAEGLQPFYSCSLILYIVSFTMPFTLSHAVVAGPLYRLSAKRLPLAALAMGAMSPDLHRLLTTSNSYVTHEWGSLFSITLWVSLGFSLVWYLLYRPFIFRCLGLYDSLNIQNIRDFCRFSILTIVATVIGIATHLIWDGLTHVDFRTFAFHDFLAQNISLFGHRYPMHRVLQLTTSALALPFLIWMLIHYYKKHKTQNVLPVMQCYKRWTICSAIFTGLLFSWRYLHDLSANAWQNDLYYHSGRSINEFFQGFLLMTTLSAALFLFLMSKTQFFTKKM